MKKTMRLLLGILLCVLFMPSAVWADDAQILRRWTKTDYFADKGGDQTLAFKVVYYSAEYVDALVRSEAEKNLWTKDEAENYKYTLLKTLNLHDSIAFLVDMTVTGLPIYAQPFNKHISLYVNGKRYFPSDYDKRFNFKILGQRDGMVYFPRYDAKTGRDILDGAKDLRLSFNSSVSRALDGKNNVVWIWDITRDNRKEIETGKAVDRLELDRLLRRTDKLKGDREKLEAELDALNKELQEVEARVTELQQR